MCHDASLNSSYDDVLTKTFYKTCQVSKKVISKWKPGCLNLRHDTFNCNRSNDQDCKWLNIQTSAIILLAEQTTLLDSKLVVAELAPDLQTIRKTLGVKYPNPIPNKKYLYCLAINRIQLYRNPAFTLCIM